MGFSDRPMANIGGLHIKTTKNHMSVVQNAVNVVQEYEIINLLCVQK